MSRHEIPLLTPADRERACRDVMRAPSGSCVEVKAPKRTIDQNSRFWAMLTDVAEQLVWHGQRLPTNDWKFIFLDSLDRETRIVPNIDGNGFVNLGRSSSDLTVAEMGDLMEIIAAFGAKHDVSFHDKVGEPA